MRIKSDLVHLVLNASYTAHSLGHRIGDWVIHINGHDALARCQRCNLHVICDTSSIGGKLPPVRGHCVTNRCLYEDQDESIQQEVSGKSELDTSLAKTAPRSSESDTPDVADVPGPHRDVCERIGD